MADVELIVSHYREDLSWLQHDLPACVRRITVYHKGDDPPPGAILLPNVGRESHTYLTHILRNYDRLADITLFVQGCVADHKPSNVSLRDHLALLAASAARYGVSTNLAWGVSPAFRPDSVTPPVARCGDAFGAWFRRMLGEGLPLLRSDEPVLWYVGGICGVRRERVLSRPRAFYERLLREVDWHVNPEQGHYFERAWYYIFDAPADSRTHAALLRAIRREATLCNTRPSPGTGEGRRSAAPGADARCRPASPTTAPPGTATPGHLRTET